MMNWVMAFYYINRVTDHQNIRNCYVLWGIMPSDLGLSCDHKIIEVVVKCSLFDTAYRAHILWPCWRRGNRVPSLKHFKPVTAVKLFWQILEAIISASREFYTSKLTILTAEVANISTVSYFLSVGRLCRIYLGAYLSTTSKSGLKKCDLTYPPSFVYGSDHKLHTAHELYANVHSVY